jgi:hypothetical protein
MSAVSKEGGRTEAEVAPESGVQPTSVGLDSGDDLRAALLRLCEAEAPRTRLWSIAPIPRKR